MNTESTSPSPAERDRLFAERQAVVSDFNFGSRTATVFDDMLVRSVPFYLETQRMLGELAAEFAVPDTNIYDLGCSTCTTFLNFHSFLPSESSYKLIGMDFSEPMLAQARQKLDEHKFPRPVELQVGDLNKGLEISDASVVVMNLTLQFVRPLHRSRLINEIYSGMREGGVLLLVEKVLGECSLTNRLFIKNYYQFKQRNGYSELEISQKREALENVLIPYHVQENYDLLRREGFAQVDTFFKWYNFCGILAIK